MNVNQINSTNSVQKERDLNSEYSYDDDGFFSDVPASGSLSRSLVALNKYVKKNLLYEDNESDNDGAYFSKESTPNKSDIKYYSDSFQSSDSGEKEEIDKAPANTTTYIRAKPVTEPGTGVHSDTDYNTNERNITSPVRGNESINEIPKSTDKKTISTAIREPVSDIPNATEQTDDYKFKQLRENPKNTAIQKSVVVIEYTDNRNEPNSLQKEQKFASLDDLTIDYGTTKDTDNSIPEKVVRRGKKHVSIQENRHTVHDASDWVNRTDIYPDVYAPLPYKSPRRYVESDVNIHYRCPVRHDPLPLVPERELARQQAEHMKRLYREQRRNKYLQELQDMQNRRHQDNFTPSQKNILPLNRYDEAEKVVAKALYTFNGQTTRELSFRKGEIIHVRRQVDANWYEGELHGRVGLFPYNYVEIQKGDNPQPQKKPVVVEGRARAKFDFTAQTNLELPLKKGEVVVLTRRIDNNWWEGRNANKMGIFPDSYVTILQEPSQNKPDPQLIAKHTSHDKPVSSPAAHSLMNGSAKRSMGPHSYTPQHNSQALSNAPPATQPLPGYAAKPAQPLLTPSERGYGPPTGQGVDLNNTEPLYVDTNAEAIPYRAMYKYRPQNPDELELSEGDTVYVLEKCDDGWYVGSSQRTGRFGTFPGNYVERI